MELYLSQSLISNPAEYADFYCDLPCSIADLCRIVQGLILHYSDGKIFDYSIPEARLKKMGERAVKQILKEITHMNSASFLQARKPAERFLGSCRDMAILLCSMLRHLQIPARMRVGFTPAYFASFNHDQAIVEYWSEKNNTWCLVDPRAYPEFISQQKITIDYDLLNVPREKFFCAAQAWQLIRKNLDLAKSFGAGFTSEVRGAWYIRNKLLQDLAALNKEESSLWDVWGYMSDGPYFSFNDVKQVECLDEIAVVILRGKEDLQYANAIYKQNKQLQIPEFVTVFNPFAQPYKDKFYQLG